MRIISQKQILEGDTIPWGWGVAWYSYTSATARLFPIPFNWIFRWMGDFYFILARGHRKHFFESEIRALENKHRNELHKIRSESEELRRKLQQEIREIKTLMGYKFNG